MSRKGPQFSKYTLPVPVELAMRLHITAGPVEKDDLSRLFEANRQRLDAQAKRATDNSIRNDYINALDWMRRRRPDLSETELRWHMKFNEPYATRVAAYEALLEEEAREKKAKKAK